MLFRAAATALVACAAHAAAEPAAQPYKLATMPLLARRDTLGYQPEEKVCGAGNSCDEACGAGFQQCGSSDAAIHCFNPEAAQSCCGDVNGSKSFHPLVHVSVLDISPCHLSTSRLAPK